MHREASRNRDRTRRLAVRYARRVKQKWAAVRAELELQKQQLDEARGQFSAEVARFNITRSQLEMTSAEEQQRLRQGWENLESHRSRLTAEWNEAKAFTAKQEAILAARAEELAKREKTVAGLKAKIEHDTAGLRQEAAGLEARAAHARAIVEELERQREALQAEILATMPKKEPEPPPGVLRVALSRAQDRDFTQWAADLEAQDRQLTQDKANVAKVKASLEREAVTLADQRKVLAEQLAMLTAARAEWQDVEARTVAELEELARALRLREDDVAAREARLKNIDTRRVDEATDLSELRKQLEEWQAKLSLVSRLWHEERERREKDLEARSRDIAAREAALQESFQRLEHTRAADRERVHAELKLWAGERTRMRQAAADYERRSREAAQEIAMHAARAMAAEDLLAETAGQGKGTTRRFQVLQKRWERVFAGKLAEIDDRRAAAAADLARLDDRWNEVQQSLGDLGADDVLPLASEEVEEEYGPTVLRFVIPSRAA
jgi:chromosome segregation ATPase